MALRMALIILDTGALNASRTSSESMVTDRGSRQMGTAMTPILKCDSMELGTGNMDLDGLLAAARENGVEDVVLESHRNWIDRDPVRSLETSAAWLNARK